MNVTTSTLKVRKPNVFVQIWRHRTLMLMFLPGFAFILLFNYGPIYGVQIAFKNFIASRGIWGSPWVGFKHFDRFFKSYYFWRLLRNTLGISLYALAVGFPAPILLALMSVPVIVSIGEDALKAVPDSYREAALALGAKTIQAAEPQTFRR